MARWPYDSDDIWVLADVSMNKTIKTDCVRDDEGWPCARVRDSGAVKSAVAGLAWCGEISEDTDALDDISEDTDARLAAPDQIFVHDHAPPMRHADLTADPRWPATDVNNRGVMICDGHDPFPMPAEMRICPPDPSALEIAQGMAGRL